MSAPLSADDLRARLAAARAEAPAAPVEAPSTPAPRPSAAPSFRRGAEAAAEATPAPPARPSTGKRSNRYGAKCVNCATWVEAEAGYLAKTPEGKWAAECIVCPVEGALGDPRDGDHIPLDPPARTSTDTAKAVTIRSVTGQVYTGVLPGIYTLDKGGEHRTFRVRVQPSDSDFAPGSTVLDYLGGPDNSPSSKDWKSFAFINGVRLAVWSKHKGNEALAADAREFLADPDAVLKSRNCLRCNAELTVPESVRRGMGPTCVTKGW